MKHITILGATHATCLFRLPLPWLWIDDRFSSVDQKKAVEGDPDDDIIDDPEEEMNGIEAHLDLGLTPEL